MEPGSREWAGLVHGLDVGIGLELQQQLRGLAPIFDHAIQQRNMAKS